MSEEEKEILHYLEGAIDTYIEGAKVTKVEMSVKDDEILLNYIDKQQKVIDLMAKHICDYGKVCTYNYGATRPEQWKEYFYRKVEEEK